MSRKLKIVQNDAGVDQTTVGHLVPAPQIPDQGPRGSASQRNHPGYDANERSTSVGIDFTPAPTRKRHAGWNCRAQPVRGTGEHGDERQRIFVERLAYAYARARPR